MYFGMLTLHVLFSIGSGIFAIHRNFKDAPKYISDCASGSEDPDVLRVCNGGAAMVKGVMIGIFIFAWLLETCEYRLYRRLGRFVDLTVNSRGRGYRCEIQQAVERRGTRKCCERYRVMVNPCMTVL